MSSAAPSTATAGPVGPDGKPREPFKAPERSGSALRRSADGARLYLADEDHRVVRIVSLPLGEAPAPAGSASAAPSAAPPARTGASASASAKPAAKPTPKPGTIPPVEPPPRVANVEVATPGAPAQVLPLDGRVLVTIRDPGLVLVLRETPEGGLVEDKKIPVAADAWGIAVSPDEKTAVVTSAWTHTVTGIDLGTATVKWTLDVGREPRGVVIHPNGKTAYVSHLTSADLTRIDDVAGQAQAKRVALPAGPMRAPKALTLPASLGYALAIDEAGHRLFAARHALGGLAERTWFGIGTVDVLQTANDTPLLAPRDPDKRIKVTPAFEESKQWTAANVPASETYRHQFFAFPELSIPAVVQPRDLIVARKSQTLWIASEGNDLVAQLPALSAAPIEKPLRIVSVGSNYKDPKVIGNGYSDGDGIPGWCGAPSGLALSADESLLYVFCRSTYDIATIRTAPPPDVSPFRSGISSPVTVVRLADDPLDETGSRGRRLFYGARDDFSSGGMGCAGCHPEGRDDGHVWHEVLDEKKKENGVFLASKNLAFKTKEGKLGYPRQTPMLAGRVDADGPYGWHAQNESLRSRLAEGFARHRWNHVEVDAKGWMVGERSNALAAFLRKGLVPPPALGRDRNEEEKRGQVIFESEATQCTKCHTPATGFTNRNVYSLRAPPPPGFEDEEDDKFKTPSLRFVGGTAPYYHDGRAATLEALIDHNGDRMGQTSHLTAPERAALVAYLRTL